MPESATDIRALIAAVEPLRGAQIIRELCGGPASDSWLLEADGKRFVARLDRPAARSLGLDRQAETRVLQTVAAAGIGPELVWAEPGNGILVCNYIEGDALQSEDLHNPALLKRLAWTLRMLHQLPPAGRPFEPGAAAQRYATETGTGAASAMAECAGKLAARLFADTARPALCHNDPVHTNIIHHGQLWLIDWEYAAVGDPYFDLAVVVQHHQLSAALTEVFLQAYFGNLQAEQFERLEAFCTLYDQLAGLWYLSMAAKFGADSTFGEESERVMSRLSNSGLA
jgi:thiamine kinase